MEHKAFHLFNNGCFKAITVVLKLSVVVVVGSLGLRNFSTTKTSRKHMGNRRDEGAPVAVSLKHGWLRKARTTTSRCHGDGPVTRKGTTRPGAGGNDQIKPTTGGWTLTATQTTREGVPRAMTRTTDRSTTSADGELAKPAGAIAQSVTRSAQQAPLAASRTTRTAPPQGNDSDD